MVIILLGLFLFFKLRKKGGGFGKGIFFSGRADQLDKRFDDLMLLILLQQVFHTPSEHSEFTPEKKSPKIIPKVKKDTTSPDEILALLKE